MTELLLLMAFQILYLGMIISMFIFLTKDNITNELNLLYVTYYVLFKKEYNSQFDRISLHIKFSSAFVSHQIELTNSFNSQNLPPN